MPARLVPLAAPSVTMAACVGLEVAGSPGPRPGFVGVCGAAGLLAVAELASLGARVRRLEERRDAGPDPRA